jgi:TRAP-type transport system small permease protein
MQDVSEPTEGQDTSPPDPPVRQSVLDMLAQQDEFPDDGPLSARVRAVDHWAGVVEQIVLFAILLTVVGVGAAQALSSKLFKHVLLWSFDVIRSGTFAIAMIGAAYATHQVKHLSMDIVTRRLSPRSQLIMRIVIGLFVIFAVHLLVKGGLTLRSQVAGEGGDHAHIIPKHLVAAMIPAGGLLIIFHTLLHIVIDIDYLRRGKRPPEKAMTGH